MSDQISRTLTATRWRRLLCAALVIATLGVIHAHGSGDLYQLQQPGKLYLETPALPDTTPVHQPDFDYFAWNSFVALNWPALEQDPNQYRGVPNTSDDPGTTFASAANDTLGVWETFKEKREIFNHPDTAGELKWYSPVDYGPVRLAKGETAAARGVGATLEVRGRTTMRTFHQNAGTTQTPDSLDETVEVQSQVLEQTLPDGSLNPAYAVIPPVATPRVWRGPPSKQNPIVYEVKLNYDYFDYVVAQGLNVNNTDTRNGPVAKQATAADIHLPYRTSSYDPPPAATSRPTQVIGYRAGAAVAVFQTINSAYATNHAKKRQPVPVPLPPGQGSVQIKAAWLKLGGKDANPADFPTWHTAFAQNYKVEMRDGKPVVVPSEPTLFGLVGLHIIQRLHTTDLGHPNSNPTGGTFIFATWEHDSIFNSPVQGQEGGPAPTYFYSNFSPGGGILLPGFYPGLDEKAYPVERRYPILDGTLKVNQLVHAAIRAANGGQDSVWCHYHLVGTQFQALDLSDPKLAPEAANNSHYNPNDPTDIGQPVFLANLAIETNVGLQNFEGQPPTIDVIQNYLGNKSPSGGKTLVSNLGPPPHFARDNLNMAFGGKGYNMGGCMGCHGVAQSKGFAFSFVLLDGYLGAATDTQKHFDQPGANPK